MKVNFQFIYFFVLFKSIPMIIFAQYAGGSGKGDVSLSILNVGLTNTWDASQNNRVLTRSAFNNAIDIGIFSATGTLTNGLQAINANTLSSSSITVTPAQGGINANFLTKQATTQSRRQLLIKGDFRSILINPTSGQGNCPTSGAFTQLLWLDNDLIIPNTTRCFTDKALSVPYTGGNGVDFYSIQNGKAIQIASNGIITALCN